MNRWIIMSLLKKNINHAIDQESNHDILILLNYGIRGFPAKIHELNTND